MSDDEHAANLDLIREQVSVARVLLGAANRLLVRSESGLIHAAARSDIYGDTLADVLAVQDEHSKSIDHLEVTEKAVLEFMKEKTEP